MRPDPCGACERPWRTLLSVISGRVVRWQAAGLIRPLLHRCFGQAGLWECSRPHVRSQAGPAGILLMPARWLSCSPTDMPLVLPRGAPHTRPVAATGDHLG